MKVYRVKEGQKWFGRKRQAYIELHVGDALADPRHRIPHDAQALHLAGLLAEYAPQPLLDIHGRLVALPCLRHLVALVVDLGTQHRLVVDQTEVAHEYAAAVVDGRGVRDAVDVDMP